MHQNRITALLDDPADLRRAAALLTDHLANATTPSLHLPEIADTDPATATHIATTVADKLESLTTARLRIIEMEARAAALAALTDIARDPGPRTMDPALLTRHAETRRKAATTLLRLLKSSPVTDGGGGGGAAGGGSSRHQPSRSPPTPIKPGATATGSPLPRVRGRWDAQRERCTGALGAADLTGLRRRLRLTPPHGRHSPSRAAPPGGRVALSSVDALSRAVTARAAPPPSRPGPARPRLQAPAPRCR